MAKQTIKRTTFTVRKSQMNNGNKSTNNSGNKSRRCPVCKKKTEQNIINVKPGYTRNF